MSVEWVDKLIIEKKYGPDNGIILFESELPGISKIIIEKKPSPNIIEEDIFAVTIIIYDKLITTSYFHSKSDAFEHADTSKLILKIAF